MQGPALAGRDALTYRYDPARAESRSAQLIADRIVQHAAGATGRVPWLILMNRSTRCALPACV